MEEEYLFTDHYKIGDIIFYTDLISSTVRKMRLRTVKDTWMVGVVAKMDTVMIGRDKKTWLYMSMLDAKAHLEELGMTAELELVPRHEKESGDDNE